MFNADHEPAVRQRYPRADRAYWELSIEAHDVPKLDTFSPSDPFFVAFLLPSATPTSPRGASSTRTRLITSETVWDTADASFVTPVDLPIATTPVDARELELEMLDRDSRSEALSKHDFIGRVPIKMAELLALPDLTMRKDMAGLFDVGYTSVEMMTNQPVGPCGAYAIITVEKIDSVIKDLVFTISFKDHKEDIFLVISKQKRAVLPGSAENTPLYRSEILKTGRTELKEVVLPLERIGGETRRLCFSVHKAVMGGEKKSLAKAYANIHKMRTGEPVLMEAFSSAGRTMEARMTPALTEEASTRIAFSLEFDIKQHH